MLASPCIVLRFGRVRVVLFWLILINNKPAIHLINQDCKLATLINLD